MTNISITESYTENSNQLKHGMSFKSTIGEIDSNTISAGEDNIMIILTASVSLRYHFESCTDERYKKSYLLIDEFDATLHPSLQSKLFLKLKEYSEKYKIQIFSTTHSLYLLEYALKNKVNIIYLKRGAGDSITHMQEPDIYKIETHLNTQTRKELGYDKKIPIFTEDKEARLFSELIFDYFKEKDSEFANVHSLFYFAEMSAGANNLKTLFEDRELTSMTLQAICFLDGDQPMRDLTHRIISLPGDNNPEQIAFNHLKSLIDDERRNDFWDKKEMTNLGITPDWVKDKVLKQLEPLLQEKFNKESHNKKLRKLQKELFNRAKDENIKQLFKFVIKN